MCCEGTSSLSRSPKSRGDEFGSPTDGPSPPPGARFLSRLSSASPGRELHFTGQEFRHCKLTHTFWLFSWGTTCCGKHTGYRGHRRNVPPGSERRWADTVRSDFEPLFVRREPRWSHWGHRGQPWGVAEGKDAVFQNKHTAETTMTAATKQAVPTMGQDSCGCFTSLYESP